MKKYSTLMLAYGANTNLSHMARRCPNSVYVGNAVVRNYRLIFRTVADVIEAKGNKLHVAVWAITPEDEATLDRFEGVPHMYVKRYISLRMPNGSRHKALCYMMRGPRSDRMEPPQGYEETLREGYRDCGMPGEQIDIAIRDAVESQRRESRTRTSWNKPPVTASDELTANDAVSLEEKEADAKEAREPHKLMSRKIIVRK